LGISGVHEKRSVEIIVTMLLVMPRNEQRRSRGMGKIRL
jgi:hypothetical protein